MALRKVSSLVAAENVLNLLQNRDEFTDLNGFVDCYQNGREQGFLIFGLPSCRAIYFANHRNSDQIVVYFEDYSMQSLSEDAHKNMKIMPNHEAAANYIAELIRSCKN